LWVVQTRSLLSQTNGVPLAASIPQAVESLPVHCTQVPPSHTFLSAMSAHCKLVLHGLQVCVVASQCDAPGSLQSDCSRQATQVWLSVSQSGVAPLQSVLAVQATQL
jgi:hypothetical protein